MYVEQPVRHLGFRRALSQWWAMIRRGPSQIFARVSAGLLALCAVATVFAIATAPAMTSAQQVVAQGASGEEKSVRIEPKHQAEPSAAPSSRPSPSSGEEAGAASGGASASSSAQPSATAESVAPTFGEPVTIVGDSVTVAASAALQEEIPSATIDAAVSRSNLQGFPLLQSLNSQGQLDRYVVVALSTNSTMVPAQLEALVQELSPDGQRKLIFVTGVAPAHLTWVRDSNAAIYELAKAHPKTVFVADWAKIGAEHPEYLVSDGVHPELAGQQAYAQAITEALIAAKKAD